MMSLRFIATLAVLAAVLGSCTTTTDKSTAIQELERRHNATMTTLGGGSGM